ncbi:MAG TPA: hypothetical protein VE776_12460 [Actinomycetota bacterium]|jgi:hypothetical protein|nr:hypothetical protein [Actinomycetota bacterium]
MASARLCLPRRFCGPPGAANGGFAAGSLAALLGDDAIEVTLRRPVPLERPLEVRHDGDGTLLLEDDGCLLAQAGPSATEVELTAPDIPTPEEARAAAGRAAYYDEPVFPDCFVCGPARGPGDGLRIFPGPVSGRSVWVAPWTPDRSAGGPDGRVWNEMVWAALDCPGGLAAVEAAAVPADTAALLGQMTARLAVRPRIGTEYQVIAWLLRRDGRKLTARSALLGPDGEVLAAATALWVTVARGALTSRLRQVRGTDSRPGTAMRKTAGGSV